MLYQHVSFIIFLLKTIEIFIHFTQERHGAPFRVTFTLSTLYFWLITSFELNFISKKPLSNNTWVQYSTSSARVRESWRNVEGACNQRDRQTFSLNQVFGDGGGKQVTRWLTLWNVSAETRICSNYTRTYLVRVEPPRTATLLQPIRAAVTATWTLISSL